MRLFFGLFFLSCFLFSGCKKEKSVNYEGQLLLTSKYPIPLVNRKIEIYQAGRSAAIGLNSGSSSALAITETNSSGFFRLNFTPGTSSFIIFTSTSTNGLTLQNQLGDTSFPQFSRSNFSSNYNPDTPIKVGKTIDTVFIKTSLIDDLAISDTIGLRAYTLGGQINREYTGRAASAGAVITLDTLYNVLFTDFDCFGRKFTNTLYAGRKVTTPIGYVAISGGFVSPSKFSEFDEIKNEILFYFKK